MTRLEKGWNKEEQVFRTEHPRLLIDPRIYGPQLVFRRARAEDASFILSLRLDMEKGQYLSKTSSDPNLQAEWIERTADDPTQNYFIIESHSGQRFGTVRLYGPRENAFCWGSWILANDRPPSAAVESTLMVYMYGLFCGFRSSYFDVRRDNVKVWQYHERMGAVRVGETESDYHYEIGPAAIANLLSRFGDRVGGEVLVKPSAEGDPITVTVKALLHGAANRQQTIVHAGSSQASVVPGVQLLKLRVAEDMRGKLTVVQSNDGLPFLPQRMFMVYDVPSRESRGEHAHLECHQMLICAHGECMAVVDDGRVRQEFLLDANHKALYMPPRIWGTQYRYSPDAVLVVLASHPYDPSDYVRDYAQFLSMVGVTNS